MCTILLIYIHIIDNQAGGRRGERLRDEVQQVDARCSHSLLQRSVFGVFSLKRVLFTEFVLYSCVLIQCVLPPNVFCRMSFLQICLFPL